MVGFEIKDLQIVWGNVAKTVNNYSVDANDVSLKDERVHLVDYNLERGFSGGPLLQGNRVIGMMSHRCPNTGMIAAVDSQYFY